jgi:hypothetical protein
LEHPGIACRCNVLDRRSCHGRQAVEDLIGRCGLTFRQLEVAVYGNNLTNAANLSWYDAEFENGRADRLRPRTIGVDLRYSF